MRHIQRITASDVISRIPGLQPYDPAAGLTFDLLICAAGFEDRAGAIASIRPPAQVRGLLLIRYPTNELDNARCTAALNELVAADRRIDIAYDRYHFRRNLHAKLACKARASAHGRGFARSGRCVRHEFLCYFPGLACYFRGVA